MVGAIGLAGFTLSTGDPVSAAGTLGVFLTGGLRIMASMLPLQNSLGSLKQLTAQADLFLGLTKDFPAEINKLEHNPKSKTTGMNLMPIEITLDQVSYRYESSEFPAVKSVSLKVPSGHSVAFIGTSGSGKSTLADLIVGLLVPTSGTVTVENPDFRTVGYVPQSPGMVTGTISENIISLTPKGPCKFIRRWSRYQAWSTIRWIKWRSAPTHWFSASNLRKSWTLGAR
jgi:ATP-binding cassette subfamily C protein